MNPISADPPSDSTNQALRPLAPLGDREGTDQRTLVTVIRPATGMIGINFAELWRYRDLLHLLVWRDLSARYRQSVVGYGWTILKPLLTVCIFTIIFSLTLRIDTGETPYLLFSLSGLIPWQYFAGSLLGITSSVTSSANMLSKVYFPRLILPLASIAIGVVELGMQLLMMIPLMIWYRVAPGWGLACLPLFVLLSVVTVLAVGLWLAALNVKFRDVGMAVPFVVQIWMYLCPVIYPLTMIPEKWRPLYCLNPMVGVVEGVRWSLLGHSSLDLRSVGISWAAMFVLLVGGLLYFRRAEAQFADVI